MSNPNAIAIDGPVASGKSVVGQELAGRLGYRFLDTGAMYRAVTWAALRRGVDLEDEKTLSELARTIHIELVPSDDGDRLLVDGEDITDHLRERDVDGGVSLVSRVSGVRAAMVEQQRLVASQGPIVMVGRDIGTVVLPDASVKVYLKASAEVRAERRYREQLQKGVAAEFQQVLSGLVQRDTIDSSRADSPLRPADDAVQIDTDGLTIEEVVREIMALVERS